MGRNETFWTIIGALLIIMVPAIIMIHPYSHDIAVWLSTNSKDMVMVALNSISIILCAYCLLRTIVGIVGNVFLPKIPMPKNKFLRISLMAGIGIFVGVVSSITTLIIWAITCILGMLTFSFVETYEQGTV